MGLKKPDGFDSNPNRGRAELLARVKNALRRGESTSAPAPSRVPFQAESPLPAVEPSGWVDQFEAELRKVDGFPHRASSQAELESILCGLVNAAPPGPVAITLNPLLARSHVAEMLSGWGRTALIWPGGTAQPDDRAAFRKQCFAASVGISGVAFALAESGSLVLTSSSEGSQLVSLAPPIHIAIYERRQVLGSLEDVLNELRPAPGAVGAAQPDAGRSIVFITGCSRTADIEQISIRGVHGPTHLHAVLVEDQAAEATSNTRFAQSSASK